MMLDFTFREAERLFNSMKSAGYEFQTYRSFIKNPKSKVVLLRHDVDDKPNNSLAFAQIQAKLGISGTYYFRTVKQSFDEQIMKEIESLGHEVGYHYEEMDFANGDIDEAYEIAQRNINVFKSIINLSTICMHGSPMSKWDNKDLWKRYDYRELGIIGEPYFDIDFDQVYYLTDTGRMWDGSKYSVRDKVNTTYISSKFHTTNDIISALKAGDLPNQLMLNFHPQRWNNNKGAWVSELVRQTIKNQLKRLMIKIRK